VNQPRSWLAKLPWLLAGAGCAAWVPMPALAGNHFTDRPEVRAFAHDVAERHHLRESTVLRLLKQAVPQPSVLKAIAPPTDPQRRSWTDYRALFVNDSHIDGGLQFWDQHRAALARARAEFGIPEEILVAIIGIETVYGRNAGNYRVLDALATLAFDYPPRADYFREELEQFLLLTRELKIDPLSVKGSYAGAIGIPQFMPGSVRRYGLDYDGDGHVDLAGNAEDAIGSIANFLAQQGWKRDAALTWPASVHGDDIQGLLDAGLKPKFGAGELASHGVTAPTGAAAPALFALVDLPSRAAATEYRLGADNFYAITRYNRSSFYGAAVVDLAVELRTRHEHAQPAA
jgi:membrane-bound lytic murein transglycosylase B